MLAVKCLFTTHLYTFGGEIFRQLFGGPIGLRGTCAVARLIMCLWDKMWKAVMLRAGVIIALYLRYMDDGRMVLHPVKAGWRWEAGRLKTRNCHQQRSPEM